MSTEYRFSSVDYDILINPTVDKDVHIIGNDRGEFFAWCDFNGFFNIHDVKNFMELNPRLVIRDESDNIISFNDFKKIIESKNKGQTFAMLPKSELRRLNSMLEFKTIESDRYEKMDDGIHVKHVGMITAKEMFDQLEAHLKKVGLLPDEYFSLDAPLKVGDTELPDFYEAVCSTDWGTSEGIYVDISLNYYENRASHTMRFATGKTLGDSGNDFLRMSRIAAECSMMLNGRGKVVQLSENAYDNLQLTEQEKGLVVKALDAMGDKLAETEGYSAGEEYWDLKAKFEGREFNNTMLYGRSAGFVEVYKLVKEARLAEPVNTKALNDIRDKYGYDLYKEALDTVLREQEKPSLDSLIRTALRKEAEEVTAKVPVSVPPMNKIFDEVQR